MSGTGGSSITYNGVTSVFNNQVNGGYETDNAGLSVLGNTNAGLRPNRIGDPFGEITGYRDAPILQFAGKVTF